jgi:hypothetical protein
MPFRLGKLPPRLDTRTLQLADYLRSPRATSSGQGTALPAKPALPPAPRSLDWTAKIPSWPMFSNDTLGDCTAAAAAHMIQCWTANAGQASTPTDAQVIAAYSATGHYVPGNPATDQGAVELDVLNFWRQQGIAGHKIAAYVAFSPQNFEHTRQAINIFGGIYVGLALPLSAQNQDVWDLTSRTTFLSRVTAFFREGRAYPARSAKNLSRISAGFLECGLPAVVGGSAPLHHTAADSITSHGCDGVPNSPNHPWNVPASTFGGRVDHDLDAKPHSRISLHRPVGQRRTFPNIPRIFRIFTNERAHNDTDPGSWGGHAVPILAYDSDTLTCITWGAKKRMTWEFFARYCDESYAPLSPDWLNPHGRTPEGLDRDALQADLAQIADTPKPATTAAGN